MAAYIFSLGFSVILVGCTGNNFSGTGNNAKSANTEKNDALLEETAEGLTPGEEDALAKDIGAGGQTGIAQGDVVGSGATGDVCIEDVFSMSSSL